MKIGEFYSVVCRIFALNFANCPSEEIFNEIKKNSNWVIKNNNEANLTGSKLYKESLEVKNLEEIKEDFLNLKKYFNAEFFFEGDKKRLEGLYRVCKFEPNLKLSDVDSITSQLSFLSSVLQLKADKKIEEILGVFLSSYFLPYSKKLYPLLQKEAKTKFYRSMGYLFEDFSEGIEKIFNIRVVPR
ncbi:hypothetical protein [Campylobacter sp. RM16187]|uniref:hypothetical protein n=1 Tax=Campylobacter sp. RM16187 TaxID=1660063 RepID=UPI0021B6435F|nr:hypothetical protein [Campylobacter sp. RM16187]QKG29790.1 hypothetical protein CDOMF_1556 [Campylobacter sp. RM16187]